MYMLRRRPGRRAVAWGAQMIAFTASALMTLSVIAAELGVEARVVAGAGSATLEGALVQAYQNNPQLNSQRAATRAVDEGVPTALAGYRPRVAATGSLTDQHLDTTTKSV